ncbi:MAG: hypothetical protein ABJB55_01945 [Actinomycetota bacterium]
MRAGRVLIALVAVATTATALTAPSVAATAPTVPNTSCPSFPVDNVWNMDVSLLSVSQSSATWLTSMSAATKNLHPDFGPPKDYGIPFDVVSDAHPLIPVKFLYADESDPGPYPFGRDISVEGSSDRHALMINRDTCTLYELYAARLKGSKASAGSGAIFDLRSNALRPATWTSADAAGLPIFPGLVRWDEVQAGFIGHALRFTVACTQRSYVWPARHQAGVADPTCPPMGARFRMKAGFDMSGYSPQARVILTAMQHYGMILADNGSDWFFQGAVDGAWPASLIAELKTVPARAFVAVDESACQVAPDSGQFAYRTGCPAP